jgi:hypothetical protein
MVKYWWERRHFDLIFMVSPEIELQEKILHPTTRKENVWTNVVGRALILHLTGDSGYSGKPFFRYYTLLYNMIGYSSLLRDRNPL